MEEVLDVVRVVGVVLRMPVAGADNNSAEQPVVGVDSIEAHHWTVVAGKGSLVVHSVLGIDSSENFVGAADMKQREPEAVEDNNLAVHSVLDFGRYSTGNWVVLDIVVAATAEDASCIETGRLNERLVEAEAEARLLGQSLARHSQLPQLCGELY